MRSNPWFAAPYYLAGKLDMQGLQRRLSWPSVQFFDRWVVSNMTACDMFHCFSSFGLLSHRAARARFGAMTVVERGSTHIEVQNELLREEHKRWGAPYKDIDKRVMDKELAEYEECDYITIQSTFAERSFLQKGVCREKLICLPLGMDTRIFSPLPKRDKVFRVCYAGSVSLRKGVLYLLQAIASLDLPNFEFVINGLINDEVKDLVKPYWHKVNYVGVRPFHELNALYSQGSVFVLPTIEDGFAIIITEMMACGVPVITTRHCGAEDVMTDGVEGFFVPIRDPAAIREKILYLYENPGIRESMSHAALRRARAMNELDTYGERASGSYETAFRAFKEKRVNR